MDEKRLDRPKLSKKERKKLAKEQRRQQVLIDKKKANFGKVFVFGVVAFIIVVSVTWIVSVAIKESSKPLPGKEVAILGKNHVAVGTRIKYNSNPPTSGDHYSTWTKNGVHDKETDDGYLVHSLEHGYVMISHNCEIRVESSKLKVESDKDATREGKISKNCLDFLDKLKERVKKDSWKLILIPRKNLDTNFALTSWGRIDKFSLKDANMERVNDFVDSFRNTGPEKTME